MFPPAYRVFSIPGGKGLKVLNLPLYIILANRAPALPGKNLMSLRHPSGHFTLHKVFSPVTHLGFEVWGTRGLGVGLAVLCLC